MRDIESMVFEEAKQSIYRGGLNEDDVPAIDRALRLTQAKQKIEPPPSDPDPLGIGSLSLAAYLKKSVERVAKADIAERKRVLMEQDAQSKADKV
jgi:hypothetical protein